MKSHLICLTLLLTCAFPPPAAAQLAPPNDAGVTMAHVHLNVLDVEAQKKFWIEQIGARPVRMGPIEALELPGLLIFLRRQNPTGPVAGSVINHLGLKVRKLDDLMTRFQSVGTPVEKPVIGRENTPQTMSPVRTSFAWNWSRTLR